MCELNVHRPQTPVPANRQPQRLRPAHADVPDQGARDTASGGPHDRRTSRWLFNLQRQLSRPNLLIIEELGFVPLSRTGAELLFEVFSQRYERGSTMVTTNLPFDEWTGIFGSERLTGALLDRLTHHVHILQMNGESYRLRGSRQNAAVPSPSAGSAGCQLAPLRRQSRPRRQCGGPTHGPGRGRQAPPRWYILLRPSC